MARFKQIDSSVSTAEDRQQRPLLLQRLLNAISVFALLAHLLVQAAWANTVVVYIDCSGQCRARRNRRHGSAS